LYALAWPLVRELLQASRHTAGRSTLVLFAEDVRMRSLQAFTVLWLFGLGASLGSFLNVVIYRWPRGRTLLGTSFCPYCTQPIRLRHNLPVLGWFILRGRCHDCRLPISVRYPLVEGAVGAVFVFLAFVELFTGGKNLPLRRPNYYSGIAWIVFDPQWDLIAIYLLHCGVVAVLLSWALIWYDRRQVPITFTFLAYAAVFAVSSLFPPIHPVPWYGDAWRAASIGPVDGELTAAIGALAGSLLGSMVDGRRGALAAGLTGAALGWQAALSVALFWPLVFGLQQRLFPVSPPPRLAANRTLALCTACLLQISCWRVLALIPGWPSHLAPLWTAPIAVIAAMLLAVGLPKQSDH
jgi:leader peptidase (prepilin peptidase)/N-methyltransferase